MIHQILLGFDSIKSIGLIVNTTLETISWNKNNYSIATTAVGVPELESEDRFEILESLNFTSEAADFAVDRSVLDKPTDCKRLEKILLTYVKDMQNRSNHVENYEFTNSFIKPVEPFRIKPYPVPQTLVPIGKALTN